MSKQIDERVVSMKFDNKQFESNVATTMSTIDKLKQKLNFTGSAKGLENINSAAKNVNMTGLGAAVDTVGAKFSALEIVGVTALANITNSAVNAGKRIVKALTIDPIKTGFQEYETQINAVQTILANTESKGTTITDVNNALEELNKYADKTIYNFTEMTRNIGTFTAAGVDLETSVNAIQGIANLAAVSGSTSQQASTAMYQLSQALASGTVKLMDWNSVVNAGMGGEVFQNALKETARVHGIAIDDMIEKNGSFRETLKDGWLTSEILTETLQKFTLTTEDLTEEQIKANREMLKAKGYTDEQIDEIFKLGKTATDAATKVKTFTQLWDVLKESAQSGWAQTWKILIGDFEEAKNLLSPLAEALTGFIDKMSKARNAILESALGKGFKHLMENVSDVMKPMSKSADAIKEVVNSVKDYDKVVNEIIAGKWGNAPTRWQDLSKAGYDWAHAQNLVNEKLGVSLRRTTNYKEAQAETAKSTEKLSETEAKRIAQLAKMTDAELKQLGYRPEQIKALRELKDAADKIGLPLDEFISKMDEINGRWLLINAFKNIGNSIATVAKAIGSAMSEIFPSEGIANGLFNAITGFHKLSTCFIISEETADKLKRTFKGVFALLDIAGTILGGPLKIGFKVITQLLGAFDLNILDVTAAVGDAIVKFRDWLDRVLDFSKVFEAIVPYVKEAANAIRDWAKAFKDSEFVQIGKSIIEGLVKGLKDKASSVWNAMLELGRTLLAKIKSVLGIHSPSTEFFEIGKNIIDGLTNGLQNGVARIWGVVKTIASTCAEAFKNIDWGSIFAASIGIGIMVIGIKLASALENLTSPMEGINDILESTATTVKAFGMQLRAQALLTIAKAIAVLVASIVVLTFIDPVKLAIAGGAIIGIMLALRTFISSMNKIDGKDAIDLGKLALMLLSISASLLIVSFALKQLSTVYGGDLLKGIAAIAGLTLAIAGLIYATKWFKTNDAIKLGGALILISATMLIMTTVIKRVSKLDNSDLLKAGAVILGFVGIIAALALVTKLFDGVKSAGVGKNLLMIAASILLIIFVAKIASRMDKETILKGGAAILAFGVVIAALIATTRLAGGKDLAKVGTTLLAMSTSILILAFVAKLLAKVDTVSLIKGSAAIALLGVLVAGLVAATRLAGGNNLRGVAATLVAMSVSVAMLGGIAVLLSYIEPKKLAKGVAAVSVITGMMALLVRATKDAQNCKGNLIVLTVAIGLLVAAVIGLSFIDPKKLATSSASIVAVISTFALLIATTSKLKNMKIPIVPILTMLGVVAALAGILWAMSALNVTASLETAGALSLLLITMSASLAVLSKTGNVSALAVVALAGIGLVVGEVGIILGLLSKYDMNASMAQVKALSALLLVMTGVLTVLSLLGGLVSASFVGIGALAVLGLVVGELAVILGLMQHFKIEPSMEMAKSLSTLLLAMSGTLVILGVVGLLGPAAFIGIGALATLIAALGVILTALGGLSRIDGFNELIKDGGKTLSMIGYALGEFVGSIVGGFTAGALSGLPEIGTLLSQFMTNATPFINGIKSIDETALNGVKALASAILVLTTAELLQGMSEFLFGDFSFADLGTELSSFMTNASAFINGASLLNADMIGGAKALAETIVILTSAEVIQALGSKLLGSDSDLGTFGEQLPALGTSLGAFATNLGTFDDSKTSTVTCAANAIKAIAQASKDIPNEGGWAAKIFGDNTIATFSSNLPTLGTNLKGFATNLGSFDEGKVAAVESAINAIKSFTNLANADLKGANKQLPDFGDNLPDLAKDVKAFCDKMPGSEKINAAVGNLEKLLSSINSISSDNSQAISNFSKSLGNFGKAGVDSFIKAFSNAKTDVKNAANAMVDQVTKALTAKEKNVKTTATNVAKKAVEGFGTQKDEAESAGKDLGAGLVKGINAKQKAVYNAGYALGQKAVQGEKDGQQSNSPSKLTIKAGKWLGEGLIIGMAQMSSKVYKASSNLGKAATGTISGTVSRIADAINSDMDAQPTIRPVLDLSDISSNADLISSMFNTHPSVGLMANANSINRMMSRRQNGANDDVVSAIGDLKKAINDNPSNVYHFGDVAYSDESAISDAVLSLVRALMMERRV